MRISQFFHRDKTVPGPQNPKLLAALKAEKKMPSQANRTHLLRILSRSIVIIAVKELPPELRGEGPFVLSEDIWIEELVSTDAQGQRVGLIFSDHQQVQARKKGAPWTSLSSKQAAQNSLRKEENGIVINPAGDWVALSRQEVEQIANGAFD